LRAESDSLEVKVIDDGSGIKKQPAKPISIARCTARKTRAAWAMFLIQALVDEAEG